MEVTLLGSGGNFPTPLPTCECRICMEARQHGHPYVREGNATFLHDCNALIDAPEAIWRMLNREQIDDIRYIFLSHHHADHTRGMRVVQSLIPKSFPISEFKPTDPPTVVLSEYTYERLAKSQQLIAEYDDRGLVEFKKVTRGDTIHLGEELSVKIHGWPMTSGGDPTIFGFEFRTPESTLLVTPDETKFLPLDELPDDVDLWIHECGMFRNRGDGTPVLTDELWDELTQTEKTFQETVEQIRTVAPNQTVLTEIEEPYGRSPDQYRALAQEYEKLNITFGYDGLGISI